MTGIKRTKLYEEVMQRIEELIKVNNLQEGDKLPSEKELASLFGVSKMATREALSALQFSGLIEVRHGCGIYLKNINEKLVDSVTLRLLTSKENLLNILELRMGLETEGVYLASKRANQEDIKKLEEILEEMRKAISLNKSTADNDFKFHCTIIDSTHNPAYVKVFNTISAIFQEGLRTSQEYIELGHELRLEVIEEHRAIIDKIKNRDGESAKEIMRMHLKKTECNLHTTL